jgi:hypothetical protein
MRQTAWFPKRSVSGIFLLGHKKKEGVMSKGQFRTNHQRQAFNFPQILLSGLQGMDFPALKEDIARRAREKQLETDIVDALEHIPSRKYRTINDVVRSISKAA